MIHRVELLASLAATNGNVWHEIQREVEVDVDLLTTFDDTAFVELALGVETAGFVAGTAALVPVREFLVPGLGELPLLELEPIVIDPTGDPGEPVIVDADGRVDGRGVVEEDVG